MKKVSLIFSMLLIALFSMGKDIKTVIFTTDPQMHCENCENKIKGNLRFEKGVKKIETNVEKQQVVITFDADKTSVEKLQRGFKKIGYAVKEVTNAEKQDVEGSKKDYSCEPSGDDI